MTLQRQTDAGALLERVRPLLDDAGAAGDLLRGRGYASNAVADLSARLLDEGKQHCSLFTDKANPTSNRIYRAVGYVPICEFLDIRFVAPDAS